MGWATKDYVTVAFSLVSLLVSLITAFFNIMERHDVVIALDYDLSQETGLHRVQTTFTNGGNQPITFTRYKLVSYEYKSERPRCQKLEYDGKNEGIVGISLEVSPSEEGFRRA